MELRVLEYFLEVTKAQSITGAAKNLHLTQPTLSRQLRLLEEELGKQLFIRGNRQLTLTEEGILLRKRAQEILTLTRITENEIKMSDESISGDIYIGTGESEGVRLLINVGKKLQEEYPNIRLHVVSGDSIDLINHLDQGLLDFAVVWDPTDIKNYESVTLPYEDILGILMPRDCSLSTLTSVSFKDLEDLPIITSRQQVGNDSINNLVDQSNTSLNIVGTYNLLFNASLMVEEGMGYAIGFDKIIETSNSKKLVFLPLNPEIVLKMNLIWKKNQVFTKASKSFLLLLQETIENQIK